MYGLLTLFWWRDPVWQPKYLYVEDHIVKHINTLMVKETPFSKPHTHVELFRCL